MQGVNKKFFSSLMIMLLACGSAFAIDNEYKNSLIKIELSKKDDNSYTVDLYTQKKYQEPVKIIKKSDLNYYILLPETKNSTLKMNSALQDIKSISTNTYSYAGQDSKNGYTKININTSKPLNFNINVKSATNEKSLGAVNEDKKTSNLAQATQTSEIQKKNLTQPKVINKTQETNKKAVSQNKKPQNVDITKIKKEAKKLATPKIEKKVKKTAKPAAVAAAPIKNEPKQDLAPQVKEENNTGILQEAIQNAPEENSKNSASELFANEENQNEFENIKNEEENIIELNNFNTFEKYILKIYDKLKAYKLHIKCLLLAMILFVAGALLVALLIAIKIRLNAKKYNLKQEQSLGLVGFKERKNKTQAKTNTNKPSNNGQYFIFDNNVAQNNFYNSSNEEKKHYELSSYDPDIQLNYGKRTKEYDAYQSKESDYDIIQKILKEDSVIQYEPNELNKVQKVSQNQNPNTIKKEPQKQKEIQKPKEIAPPVVLSSVEIAPERGFMCISYNDNINLFGYIFDDVYALYNFKQPKLENYDIKYRLSDKDEKGANFIVKVENTKMLIRVTKSFMTLEVLL